MRFETDWIVVSFSLVNGGNCKSHMNWKGTFFIRTDFGFEKDLKPS